MIVCFSGCTYSDFDCSFIIFARRMARGAAGWSSGHGGDVMDAWVPVVPRNRIIRLIMFAAWQTAAGRNKCIVFSVIEWQNICSCMQVGRMGKRKHQGKTMYGLGKSDGNVHSACGGDETGRKPKRVKYIEIWQRMIESACR